MMNELSPSLSKTAGARIPASMLSRQVAALPVFFDPKGQCHVLLVTTRKSGKWIVPKGWHIPGLTGFEAAQREAFEEAGVRGIISQRPIAAFDYIKTREPRTDLNCRVDVYVLHVREQLEHWPEQKHRRRRWVPFEEAPKLVAHPALGKLMVNNQASICEVVHA